jgi:hypothetical protein
MPALHDGEASFQSEYNGRGRCRRREGRGKKTAPLKGARGNTVGK